MYVGSGPVDSSHSGFHFLHHLSAVGDALTVDIGHALVLLTDNEGKGEDDGCRNTRRGHPEAQTPSQGLSASKRNRGGDCSKVDEHLPERLKRGLHLVGAEIVDEQSLFQPPSSFPSKNLSTKVII